jgi:predicted transcriptional regulator
LPNKPADVFCIDAEPRALCMHSVRRTCRNACVQTMKAYGLVELVKQGRHVTPVVLFDHLDMALA